MNLIEAKVEAALFSKMQEGKEVWIVKVKYGKEFDYFLSTNKDDEDISVTFYKHGCEKGVGYTPPVARDPYGQTDKKRKKKTAMEIMDEREEEREVVKKLKGDKSENGKSGKGKTKEDSKSSGKSIKMTYKALRKEVVAGNVVFNKAGKSIPVTAKAEKQPDKQVNVVVEEKGKKKFFKIV